MTSRIAFVLAQALVWTTLGNAQSLPGEERARAAFFEGSEAFEGGDFSRAFALYTESYELSGRAELLYNIGLSAERMQDREEALTAYERFLREQPESERRASVEARVVALREAIERDRARAAAVQAESDAARAEADAARRAADLERQRAREAEEGSRLVEVSAGSGPWVVAGIGVALVGAGVALALVGNARINRVNGAAMGPWTDALMNDYDTGPTFATAGWIVGGVGVAAIASGIIWAVTGKKLVRASELRASVGFRSSGASIGFQGTF